MGLCLADLAQPHFTHHNTINIMISKITKQQITEAIDEAYYKFKVEKSGANADYIPYLANVPSNLFGITVCLNDGSIIERGDTNYIFGIESISKVPTAILAMRQYGTHEILD